MCGIAGYFNLDARPADPAVLRKMVGSQRHRGPDDQGMRLFSLERQSSAEYLGHGPRPATNYEGALGFNRLSILDLSKNGHQPMCNKDGTSFIAFNGEIYNAFSYTEELKESGFEFRSRSDTEVILYLYERDGFERMLERLNGMFAIVIVDLKQREIHIARDHLGIKPFYWAIQGRTFFFSSEVKSFLAHPEFQCDLDVRNLDEYLAFRYCTGDRHLVKGVQQLRPGHRLRLNSEGLSIHRYWQIPDPSARSSISFPEALDRLDVALRASVKSQLLSDVKVGCQLSGGIDSSLVTLFARCDSNADLDAFSVIFQDPRCSEENWISEAAAVTMADSHRFFFTPESFFDNLESCTWHLDQPLNHPNSIGIYLLAEKSRQLVTVLLSGEGADELLGGYLRFYYSRIRPRLGALLPALSQIPKLGAKFKRVFAMAHKDPVNAFIASSQFAHAEQLLALRPELDLDKVIEERRMIFAEGQADHLRNCLKYDMQTYMVDLLVRQDKMTMAHSLENRVPFLDRELVSFVRSLPGDYLVGSRFYARDARMRNTKVLLKELARRNFRKEFVYRIKSGFEIPLANYFTDKRFEQLMEERVLPGMRRRGLFDSKIVERWWRSPSKLQSETCEIVWIIFAFEIWAERFLDHPSN